MDNKKYIYEEMPTRKAVLTMAIPTVVSQIISMVYNMADTFFIGRLNDPSQVAAVAVAAPAALVLTALANLLGIGGVSVFSRNLGVGDALSAKKVSAFSFWGSLFVGLIISAIFLVFPNAVLSLLGATSQSLAYTQKYTFWVITIGAAPALLSMVMSHFVRADGAPKFAGLVLSAGGIINLILDPVFIFDWGLGLGITGAAIATLISNVCVFLLFVYYFYRRRAQTAVSFSPHRFSFSPVLAGNVVGAGLPSMLQTMLASVSNVILNHLAGSYGAVVVAAFGVVKKLDQIPMSVAIGFAQGVVPIVAYSVSGKNHRRAESILRFTLLISVSFSAVCVALYELFPQVLISIFINHPDTVRMGAPILRIMCCSTPCMAIAFTLITVFQASGRSRYGIILSVMRKGALDIPLMIVLNTLMAYYGIALVQPITEILTMVMALFLYRRYRGQLVE